MAVSKATTTKDFLKKAPGTDYTYESFQNIGNGLAIIKYSATIPNADDKGHKCEKGEGLSSGVFGQGITWGKAIASTIVEVTK